jgi:ribosomal protein S18 acetylase RimI-like enzyme
MSEHGTRADEFDLRALEPESTIRPVDESDAERLALVGAASFLETYAGNVDGGDIVAHAREAHSPAAFRTLLGEPGARAWLAEVEPGRAPVGYAVLTRPDLPDVRPGDLEVRRIYVLAPFQGRRIGVRLLNETIAAAQAAGASRLLLGVYSVNAGALAFYTRSGFRRVGMRQFAIRQSAYQDFVLARDLD